MKSICPRCRERDIANTRSELLSMDLRPELDRFLRLTEYAGLCSTCLEDLNRMMDYIDARPLPEPSELEEGIHYTMQGGLLVFTELYHIWKGYCCRNACRNCAYRSWEK